jgi:hypothetical protein
MRLIENWHIPDCVTNENIIEFEENTGLSDWGIYCVVKVDTDCIDELISLNGLVKGLLDGDTVYRISHQNDRIKQNEPWQNFYVNSKNRTLIMFHYEE